jgi:hypothetical protein
VLGGQSLSLCGGLETIDGSLGSGARLVPLDVHPGRRQAVQDRRRDHGIEGKGDTGDVGLERGPRSKWRSREGFLPAARITVRELDEREIVAVHLDERKVGLGSVPITLAVRILPSSVTTWTVLALLIT